MNKKDIFKFALIGILIFVLIYCITTVVINHKENEKIPLYSDVVSETFNVEFLTESSQIENKEEYLKLFDNYVEDIKNLETTINNSISNIIVGTTTFSEYKTAFSEYKDDVIKAELYKRGFIVKDDIIIEADKYNLLRNYVGTIGSFYSLSSDKLKTYGIKEEEILRYFTVTKSENNIILLTENKYKVENSILGYTPKTIYVLNSKDGKTNFYGVYPLKLDTFDASFLR